MIVDATASEVEHINVKITTSHKNAHSRPPADYSGAKCIRFTNDCILCQLWNPSMV